MKSGVLLFLMLVGSAKAQTMGANVQLNGSPTSSLIRSTVDVYISQIGCPQGADLATGYAYGTATAAADAGPCISAYLNAHAVPGQMLVLHQDGASAVTQIYGPQRGGWGIVSDNRPGMSATKVSTCTISANSITCTTQTNTLVVGQSVILNGFANTSVNGLPVQLSSVGATTFTGAFTHANATLSTGVAQTITGNGFFQIAGSNVDVIHNGSIGTTTSCPGGYEDRGWGSPGPPPSRGSGIVIRNLFINGNGANQSGVGGYPGDYAGPYCEPMGISIQDMNDVVVEGNYTFNTYNYHERFDNVGHLRSLNQTFSDFGPGTSPYEHNGDGLHIDGNSNDIVSLNDTFATGDDAFALNSPEGTVGPISEVSIINPHYEGALSGGRVYTDSIQQPSGDNVPTVSHLIVSGGVGTVQVVAGIIGNEGTTSKPVMNTMWDIHYTDNHITMQPGNYAGSNPQGSGYVISDNIEDISFEDNSLENVSSSVSGFVNTTAGPTINALTLRNNTLLRTAAGYQGSSAVNLQAGYASSAGAAHIGRLQISGFNIVDTDGSTYTTYPNYGVLLLSPQTIGTLYASGIDESNFVAVTNTPAQITSVVDASAPSAGTASCPLSGTPLLTVASGAGSGASTMLQTGYANSSCVFSITLTTGTNLPTAGTELLEAAFANASGAAASFAVTPSCFIQGVGAAAAFGLFPGAVPGHMAVYSNAQPAASTTYYMNIECRVN